MKTYTGPTLGGATATITCPDWCTADHEYDNDHVDDTYHESDALELKPPRDRDRNWNGPTLAALLSLRISMHSTEMSPSAVSAWLQYSEYRGDGIELDVQGLDQLLAGLDAYRAGVVEVRKKLAQLDAERRRR